jgi:hypothetical protein
MSRLLSFGLPPPSPPPEDRPIRDEDAIRDRERRRRSGIIGINKEGERA